MTTLKLYYEGWLALPTAFRQKLGLNTNAVLEAELVGGTIVLRPAAGAKSVAEPEPEQEAIEPPAAAAVHASSDQPDAPAEPEIRPDEPQSPEKRRPGRPHKAQIAGHLAEPAAAPKRPRGRPRKVEPTSEPNPTILRGEGAGSERRRKMALPAALHEHGAARGRRPARPVSGASHEREERRP